MSEKSICVFTNFWDANALIDYRFMMVNDYKNEKIYKVNFLNEKKQPINYSVHSIALNHPGLTPKLDNIKNIDRLDVFCPTYDLLRKYKNDGDWEYYTKRYMEIIKERRKRIREWMDSLKPNWIYLLCCWENTVKDAHCHRELLYDSFSKSKTALSKMMPVYRHGNKMARKNIDGYNGNQDSLVGTVGMGISSGWSFHGSPTSTVSLVTNAIAMGSQVSVAINNGQLVYVDENNHVISQNNNEGNF